MLGIDVLVLVYHLPKWPRETFSRLVPSWAGPPSRRRWGGARFGRAKEIISIEVGGRLKDHRLATRDIFKDLKKNLSRVGLLEAVTLINGSSFDESTITAVREMTSPGAVGLFIFDADANVRRDIDHYRDRFAHGCWVVIDDYISATDKGGPTRAQVDDLAAEGRLQPLGFYGWGPGLAGGWGRVQENSYAINDLLSVSYDTVLGRLFLTFVRVMES